jgi:hypothetical protein
MLQRQLDFAATKAETKAVMDGLLSVRDRLNGFPLKFDPVLFSSRINELDLELQDEIKTRKFNLLSWVLGNDAGHDKGVRLGLTIARDLVFTLEVKDGLHDNEGKAYRNYLKEAAL